MYCVMRMEVGTLEFGINMGENHLLLLLNYGIPELDLRTK